MARMTKLKIMTRNMYTTREHVTWHVFWFVCRQNCTFFKKTTGKRNHLVHFSCHFVIRYLMCSASEQPCTLVRNTEKTGMFFYPFNAVFTRFLLFLFFVFFSSSFSFLFFVFQFNASLRPHAEIIKTIRDGEPSTATSTFTQLLGLSDIQDDLPAFCQD